MTDLPMTDHEHWAETEAQFYDKMVEEYMNSAKGWHAKGVHMYGENTAMMVLLCQAKASTYNSMAQNLRRPRQIRLSQESDRAPN